MGRGDGAKARYLPTYLLVGVAAIVVYFALQNDVAKAFVYDALELSAGVAIVIGVRRNGPSVPRQWHFIAISAFCFAAGDVVFDLYDLVRPIDPVPVPSWADAFYLASYPFLVAALWGMARHRLPSRRIDAVLDFFVIWLAAAIGVAGPLITANADGHRSVAAILISTSYPIFDVVALVPLAYLLLDRGLRNPATQLLLWSMVCLAIGDVVFAYLGANGYDVGAGVDVTWLAHAVFLGAAALHPAMVSVSERPPQKATPLGSVRAVIFALALLPLVLPHVSDAVLPLAGYLEVPTRLALIIVVLARLIRLGRETEKAHADAASRSAALATAREALAYIVRGATDAIISGDEHGVVTSWNHGAEMLLGVAGQDAIGKPVAQFVAEDIEPWAEAFRNMMPGDIRSAVLPAIRADGVAILVDVRLGLATARDGQPMGWVAVARDASEALVAGTTTNSAELDPAAVLANVKSIVGRVVDVTAVALIAFNPDQHTYHEVFTVGERVPIHLPDAGALTDEVLCQLRDLPTVFRAADEALDVAPVRSFLERSNAARAVGVTVRHATLGPVGLMLIGLASDAAPAESVLETIRALVPSLTRVSRSLMLDDEAETAARTRADLEEMRADFSHFLRTDMRDQVAAIRSVVNVLADNKIALGDSWRDRLMANLSASVDTLEHLVGDVAMAGLVVDGRFPCELRDVDDLAGIIRDTVDAQQATTLQRIDLAIGELPRVRGDATRLSQAIATLIANAAKFSPPDEPISVTANCDPSTGRARIAVRDRGIGIAPEDQSLIFRRFARLASDDGDGTPQSGSGLGLYIAQGIVESHGGRISVTSAPGEGSIFYIELPAATAPLVSAGRVTQPSA